MYDIFYDFISTYLFNSTDLSSASTQVLGMSMSMNEWLSHTTTIVCIGLIVMFLVLLVRWLFRLVSGLFMLK